MGMGAKILGAFSAEGGVSKGLDIIDQLVVDKDAANEMKAAFYLTELNTKTIPIVDALHKMGRQLLAVGQMGFYMWCLHKGYDIDWELVAGVSGATGLYTAVKGKGRG